MYQVIILLYPTLPLVMATIQTYGRYSTPSSRERLTVSASTTGRAVNPRNGSLWRDFCLQEPSASPTVDLASTSRQIFRHVVALVRLVFVLYIMSLKPAARLCRSLTVSFLRCLVSTTKHVPKGAQLLGSSLQSKIRGRWPGVWRLMDRIIILPLQLMQAIVDFPEANRHPTEADALQWDNFNYDIQMETVVTARLGRRPSTPTARHEYEQNQPSLLQISAPIALDDIPTLEERSVPSLVGNLMLESSPFSNCSHETGDRSQSKITPIHGSPTPEAKANDKCCIAGPATTSFELTEPNLPMHKDAYHNSVDPLQPPREFPKSTIKRVHVCLEQNTDSPWIDTRNSHTDVTPARSETSSAASDPTHAESFSPVQFSLPYSNEKQPLTTVRTLSTWSPQTHHGIVQPPPVTSSPAASTPPPPNDDHASTASESHSSSLAKHPNLNPSVTKWARRLRQPSSETQPAWTEPFHPVDDYYVSETASCCGETCSRPTTTKKHCWQQQRASEADDCSNETCISCEACDRRHKRTNHYSRIPRRVKTLEAFRGRSSSAGSCHSMAQTVGEVAAVGRRKLQKRKIKVY